jgi:hypothetical protein
LVLATAVTIAWQPDGDGSRVSLNDTPLQANPTELVLNPGTYALTWLVTGPKGADIRIIVQGAQYPTDPITDKISDEYFAAGYSDVLV